jgi:Flp pilus assembly protein TadD
VLELAGRTDDALRVLDDAQHRWPEVAAIRVAQGIILAAHQNPEAARKALETAATLGAHSPEMWYALADTTFRAGPAHLDAAEAAIGQALQAAPGDAQAQELARRIAATKSEANQEKGTPDETVDPAKLFLTRPPRDW